MRIAYKFAFSLVIGLFLISLIACGGDDESTGGTATLTWEPVSHPMAIWYTVHYGKQSSEEPGACHYEYSVDVQEPYATITGLEFDTLYFFAVSAHSGARSRCSNEVSKLVSSSQPQPQSS
jgi:hypothetical protein